MSEDETLLPDYRSLLKDENSLYNDDDNIDITIQTIKNIDIEKLKALLVVNELHGSNNFLVTVLNGTVNFDIVDPVNIERINLLHRKCGTNKCSMVTMLRNYYYIDEIKSMGINKFKKLLNSGELFKELQEKLNSHTHSAQMLLNGEELFRELQEELKLYAQSFRSLPNRERLIRELREELNSHAQNDQLPLTSDEFLRWLLDKLYSQLQSIQSPINIHEHCLKTKSRLPRDEETSFNEDPFLNVLSINTDVLKLLVNSEVFDFPKILSLLVKSITVETINKMDVDKLKLLLSSGKDKGSMFTPKKKKLDEQSNSVQTKEFDETLKKFVLEVFHRKYFTNSINLMDADKLTLLLQIEDNFGYLKEILNSQDLIRSVNSLNEIILVLILDKLDHVDYALKILGYPTIINTLGHERLSILLDSERFSPSVILSLLIHEEIVDLIISINIDIFTHLVKNYELHDYLIKEFLGMECYTRLGKIKLLLHSDKYCTLGMYQLVKEKNTFESLELIDIERFKIIVYDGMLYDEIMTRVIKSENIISQLNSMVDIDKVKFLITYEGGMLLLRLQNVIDHIIAFDIEKLRILSFYKVHRDTFCGLLIRGFLQQIMLMDIERYTFLVKNRVLSLMLEYDFFVPGHINAIEIEKLNFLGEKYNRRARQLFTNINIIREITFMNTDRLKVLVDNYKSVRKLRFTLKNIKLLNFINTFNIESLKGIARMIAEHDGIIVFLLQHYEDDLNVQRNLNFAVALHRAGKIRMVDREFLNDNNEVYNAVAKVFPKGYPIHRILSTTYKDNSPVSSLGDLCIEAWIIANKG